MNSDFRAVGNRCAVDLHSLKLEMSEEEILSVLETLGITRVNVNLVETARRCVTLSRYRRGARKRLAPGIVDCSSFVCWVYAMRGIELRRRSIQQLNQGVAVSISDLKAGDLVFKSGLRNWFDTEHSNVVGHVGLATGEGTVIHAAGESRNIVEDSLAKYFSMCELRLARRIIPETRNFVTLEIPESIDVEVSDDVRWIVLQTVGTYEERKTSELA